MTRVLYCYHRTAQEFCRLSLMAWLKMKGLRTLTRTGGDSNTRYDSPGTSAVCRFIK